MHSTGIAIIKVVDDLLAAVESKTPPVLLLLDISAAYDILDHRRLLQRRKQLFRVTGAALGWLRSYLENRRHSKSVGGRYSKTVTLTTDVALRYAYDTKLYSVTDASTVNRITAYADAVIRWYLEN